MTLEEVAKAIAAEVQHIEKTTIRENWTIFKNPLVRIAVRLSNSAHFTRDEECEFLEKCELS